MSTYLVFGRRSYPEPLEAQGRVEAPDAGSARGLVLAQFPGPWVELVLIPVPEVHWVLGPGVESEAGRVESRMG